MAPKKAKTTTPTAPRRSARLASRSPSVEPQEPSVSRIKKAKATPKKKQKKTPEPQVQETFDPFDVYDSPFGINPKYEADMRDPVKREKLMYHIQGMTKAAYRLKLLEVERVVRQDREEKARAAEAARAAEEAQKKLMSPPHSPSTPDEPAAEQQQPISAPPATTSSTTPPSTVERAVGWFKSFFGKRQAEEPAEEAPSAKRTRIEEPATASTSSSPSAYKAHTDTTSQPITQASEQPHQNKAASRPVKNVKRKRDKEPVTAPSPPSSTEEADYEHTTPQPHTIPEVHLSQSEAADESDHEPAPTPTPRRILTPKSPRDYGVPSTKNPARPTSLSTITEYTEPSYLSESIMEETPSKAPRQQPQSNTLQVPQSTPARRQPTTPSMRRSATIRAARSAGNITPRFGLAGAAASAPPKPRESNADTRQAKLLKVQRRDELQRELDELNQDEDIKELDSHRVKRVKIDNLVEIPHNRPGDPAGCFRFPEEDSDDEMEVYENVEERSNVFEEATMNIEEQEEGTIHFDFPDVGQVPDDYHVTEEYREAAGRLFTEGFNAWLLAA